MSTSNTPSPQSDDWDRFRTSFFLAEASAQPPVDDAPTEADPCDVLPAHWRGATPGIVRRNRLAPHRWQWVRRDERGHVIVSRRSFHSPTEAAIWLVRASGHAEGLNAREIGLELLYGVRAARGAAKARTTPAHPYAAEAGSLSVAVLLAFAVVMGTAVEARGVLA